jgi:hypothetical protein
MATWPKISGLDAALAKAEQRIYDNAYAIASKRLRGLVFGFAVPRWPVGRDQGRAHSQDLFRIEDKSNGRDRVYLIVENDARGPSGAPYAFYIRSAQVPGAGKKNAWLVLIRRPVLKLLSDLAREIVDDPLGEK